MSNILKLIYLVSLILYSLCTDCSGLPKSQCESATDCTYTENDESCDGTGCTLNDGTCLTSTGCNYIDAVEASCDGTGCEVNGNGDGCVGESCTFDDGSARCTGDINCVVSGDTCVTTSGCTHIPASTTCSAIGGQGNEEEVPPTPSGPSTFTTITIKLISVSGNNIVISITPDTESEKEYKTSAKAIISGLSLVDSGSFNQELKCEISSGYKLSFLNG